MLIGTIGKPSAGKSTFFKAATLMDVLIASYPFATIKPNHGIGYVKVDCIESEFKVKCQPAKGFCLQGKRFVPVELMDVAGLVKGASEGKGLGNQFLDDLRQADAFIQIVDAAGVTDSEGKQAENHDPCEDVRFLEEELDLWYLGILKKLWRSFARGLRGEFAKEVAKQFSGLKLDEEDVKSALRKTTLDTNKASQWNEEEVKTFARALRIIGKPMIVAANKADLPGAKENIEKLKKTFPDKMIIACSADSELALREATKAGLIDYIPGENSFKMKEGLN